MAGGAKDLNYRITVDQSAGTAGVRDFSRAVTTELRRIDTAFDQTDSAATRAAQTLNQMADKAAAELTAATTAADALANALGPEMAAKLGRNGIAETIGDLSRMGVTFEEIEANADELAASIKRIDDVQTSAVEQGMGNLSGKLREAGEAADQSRSVLANMAGNSAQSVAQLGGVVGDLGMGLGQIAEYATEGNIRLGNLAQIAGPMALLSVATQAFASVMEGIDFSKTFKAEAVKDWTEAMRAGETTLSHLEDLARTTGIQVDAAGGGFLGLSRHAADLAPHLQKLNLYVDDFARLTAAGSPELAKMRAEYGRLVNLGPQASDAQTDLANSMQFVIAAAEQQRDAIADTNAEMERIAAITRPTTEAVEQAVEAWKLMKDPVAAMPAEFDRVAAALRDGVAPAAADVDKIMDETGMTFDQVFDQADGLNQKLRDTEAAMDDTAAATQRARDNADKLDRKWADLTGTLDDESAFLSIQDAFDDVKAKGEAAFIAAAEKAADAEAKGRDYQQSLIDAKADVVELGRQLGISIPDVKRMLLLIDDQQIPLVEQQLAIMARNRTMTLSIVAAGGPGYGTGYAGNAGPRAVNPTTPVPAGLGAPAPFALDAGDPTVPAAGMAMPSDVVVPVVLQPVAVGPTSLTLDMRGAIMGSRYDITRTVRNAVRDGIRIAGARGTAP
jgi:methyl-accepting chemotaxis protein